MADADTLVRGCTKAMFTTECITRNNCKQMHTLLKYIGQTLY